VSAPAGEDLRELERELTVAAEQGETREFGRLREEFGVGTQELQAMLDALREHGKAVEEAPGEWRGPTLDEVDSAPVESPRVMVSADVPEDEGGMVPADGRIIERHGHGGLPAAMFAGQQADPNVRLTMAIAEALEAEALGQLVKAAIAGLPEHESFILEITP
jgi:hypothetical protein